jgi:hypothetical protein
MTVPIVGSIGAELALLIKQGSDFVVEIDLTDDNDVPLNTALYDAVANLRKKPFAPAVVTFVCTFPIPGRLRITLPRTATATLTCGEFIDDDASLYVWDCELVIKSDGTTIPAFFGDVNVFRNI